MSIDYFGTDGIRGRVGVLPITPEFAMKLGWAMGKVLASHHGYGSKVLIGKDTRISGYMLEAAWEAGLSAAGVGIRLSGPMPTPAIAYLTRALHAEAGIVISASHNPHTDNGFKFFSAQGTKFPVAYEQAINQALAEPLVLVDSAKLGKALRIPDAPGRYIEFCKGTIPANVDLSGLRIVVDCAHGATYHIAPSVFEERGAHVTRIGVSPSGLNINENCGATAPSALQAVVRAQQAHVGIALDGDGDRLIMVDERGEIVDGDDIVYIIAKARKLAGQIGNEVVGTVMSNLGLEEALSRLNLKLLRTPVGDRYVIDKLYETGNTIGGESSGHIICLDRSTTGDGIIAALQVLAIMVQSCKGLHELHAELNKRPQSLVNIKTPQRVDLQQAKIQAAIAAAEAELAHRGRVLVRASGTEPVVRVLVEGVDALQVMCLAEQLAEPIRAAAEA